MPKRVFWPATLVTMGLIFLASNMGYLPREFWDLWPVILIVVGLGGLLTSDREEWLSKAKAVTGQHRATGKPVAKSSKSAPAKKAKSRR